MFHVELTNDNGYHGENDNHYHRANENHYHRTNENHYHRANDNHYHCQNRRVRASAMSMQKRPRCAKKCDQVWAVWSSLLFAKGNKFFKLFRRGGASAVSMQFQLSCSRRL